PPAFRAEPCVKLSFLWSQRSFVPNKPLSPPALPSFDALIPSLATNLRSGELSRLGQRMSHLNVARVHVPLCSRVGILEDSQHAPDRLPSSRCARPKGLRLLDCRYKLRLL